MKSMFENRALYIATKHGKERVISPMLIKYLGVLPFTNDLIDTDSLGTFTGEIERTLSPIEAARQKCMMAYEMIRCDLVLASEGSFGAHPYYGFIPANEEFLVFKDFKNNIEIVQRHLSTKTNHNAKDISSLEDLIQFSKQSNFPSHGLVLRKKNKAGDVFIKGITTHDDLLNSFEKLKQDGAEGISVETDMRAMFNPTRMKVIAECAEKLVSKIKSCCPNCDYPGFSVTSHESGLPCQLCGLPTKSTLTAISSCLKCSYTLQKQFPNGKTHEEPTFCDFCNP